MLRRSARRRDGLFLVEGSVFVLEALRSGFQVEDLFFTEDAPGRPEIEGEALARDLMPATVPESVLKAMSDSATPQGVVAVAAIPEPRLEDLKDLDLVLVLASVRDPGNAGTLVRSAVAAGAQAVVFGGESVDAYSPKTVRSSAGNLFKVPIVLDAATPGWSALLRTRGLSLIGADATAPSSFYDVDLTAPSALVVGNESWGMPEEIRATLDTVAGIPMPGPAESLNAGIAGSLFLFEAVRQRRLGFSDE